MATPFIRVRGLEQKFGSQVVLRGIDLDIFQGETLVLLGGSGGGKSVLLKHLPGLLRPWKGSVEIDGVEISHLDERELSPYRRKVGIMFQGSALFDSMSVGENIAFPLRESGGMSESAIQKRVTEVLDIVRLHGQHQKMPAELSGGMRKRVALARAVVGQPACVLYDEPHAGLDPITADSIDHLIKDLQIHHGMTNVVVTHEMRSVFHIADRVVFLQQGRIHWSGSPRELMITEDPILRPFIDGNSGEPWP
ncbi:MAG: ATP-binding cassette domain-containing protein [Verrucomicrobia bacterium]|nr:MAG: ATP-binding cassette domain-containing protein [Verrucomicrobiota bacterium]TAE87078.1 MAG: ATP-binding cassette domain-containing protein [Verrucomicrobiota bacterium]TAF24866.1 MAG: ATP-binding cassette domain-containing protein [Verrucomicrobiota bacterium]TAF40627.1 MAG: ATP-binding cassette domain-containing protein [Verrucomicrobiota bacterium]